MTTDLYGTLAVLAATGSAPNSDLLAAVADGLSSVHVDPWAEWYGIPSQRSAPSRSPRAGTLSRSALALTELPRRHSWP